jgi:[1-hydroxy-2-(trimethylamino)ethyl]phosphonate dioxygenase
MDPIEQILAILQEKGGAEYGSERVTQLEHALQSAHLAEAAGAAPALIAAALLHDFGHMIHDLGRNAAERGLDDRHEVRGRDWLGQWFAEDVTAPVRLHVDAKRYLCAVDPGYFATLSPASVRSLQLQGGPFAVDRAESFIGLPHAPAAVELRRWDDTAKEPGRRTPDLAHFRTHLQTSLRPV